MTDTTAPQAPPFCPNPECPYHRGATASWRWVRNGYFSRRCSPRRIRRFRCCHCRRHFSEQTFCTTCWLKRPELLVPTFHRLVGCSGFRQIAREFECSPQTIATCWPARSHTSLRSSPPARRRSSFTPTSTRITRAPCGGSCRSPSRTTRSPRGAARTPRNPLFVGRRFPSRVRLPQRWAKYYWRKVTTRMIPRGIEHRKVFAM